MKTKKLEKWLLLEQSGELSPRKLRALRCELARSEDTRALRNELGWLKNTVLTPVLEPSPWSVSKIAARLRGDRRTAFVPKVWKSALALAACLMAVVGIFNFHDKRVSSTPIAVVVAAGVDVWNDPLEEDLSKLESLIVASSDSLDVMEM
jgi:ferric-dicitrate binding protein FerR (iron transport regulator)